MLALRAIALGLNMAHVQVLHIDRNNYYGGASASLQLSQVSPPRPYCLASPLGCSDASSFKDENPLDLMQCLCLNTTQLWEKFRPGQPLPKELGPNRDYNIDLAPKFMMANGAQCHLNRYILLFGHSMTSNFMPSLTLSSIYREACACPSAHGCREIP